MPLLVRWSETCCDDSRFSNSNDRMTSELVMDLHHGFLATQANLVHVAQASWIDMHKVGCCRKARKKNWLVQLHAWNLSFFLHLTYWGRKWHGSLCFDLYSCRKLAGSSWLGSPNFPMWKSKLWGDLARLSQTIWKSDNLYFIHALVSAGAQLLGAPMQKQTNMRIIHFSFTTLWCFLFDYSGA